MPARQSLPPLLPLDAYELTAEDKRRFAQERRRGLLAPQEPLLSRAVSAVDPRLVRATMFQTIVKRLLQIAGSQQRANQHDKRRRTLVGLAAPQIGEPWRIIVVDTKIRPDRKNPGNLECFINPEIVWRSRETEEVREGCFSAGPVWGLVRRPVAVKIRALTPDGQKTERIFEGFTARIVQHEIDHLDGIRFPDRIRSDKKRHWVHSEELSVYPEHIHHWPRICTRDRWTTFKLARSR